MLDAKTSIKGKVILAIGAHPDDLEFGCSGTMAKWIKEGAEGYYIIITDGTKGSEDISLTAEQLKETRYREQKEAGEVLGLKNIFFLDFTDGELVNTPEVRRWVVRIIRQVKPDVVICQDPAFLYDQERGYINHPDHRTAGQIALDSVFPFARNARTFPELLEEDLTSHKVSDVLLSTFGQGNFYVDITKTMEIKLKALSKHVSQQEDPEGVKKIVKHFGGVIGEKAGYKYAEAFTKISIER
jgi:LmbE family N-acetylglucosaminyl deacetylase